MSVSTDALGDSGIAVDADSRGGSINVEGLCDTMASGNRGISSLPEEVSMVI